MAAKIIELETREGQYGMGHTAMVIEHPEHGRLLLVDGFGGVDTPKGGAYRWEHGAVYRLQPSDTLESLRAAAWNEGTSLYDAVVRGLDHARPALEWPGAAVRALAVGAA